MENKTIMDMAQGEQKFFVGHFIELGCSKILHTSDEIHKHSPVRRICKSFEGIAGEGNFYYDESSGRVVTEFQIPSSSHVLKLKSPLHVTSVTLLGLQCR
eukprot:scaffold11636_cov62-Cyclotella_meneghiniana.AAC.8